MLKPILAIFKARYALTLLLVYGAVQTYSFAAMVFDKLPSLPFISSLWASKQSDDASASEDSDSTMGPIAAAVVGTHPLLRVLYWTIGYGLLCFAGTPLIKRALACESNVVNGLLILGYCVAGGLLASALMAFRLNWLTGFVGALALVCSVAAIVRLAGELERFRIEDTVGHA